MKKNTRMLAAWLCTLLVIPTVMSCADTSGQQTDAQTQSTETTAAPVETVDPTQAALDAALLRMHVVVIAAVIPLTPMPGAIQAFGYPTLQTAVQMIGTLGVRTLWMQLIYGKVVEASLFNLYLCYPITYSIVTLGYAAIVIVLLVRYKKDKLKDKI